ncbi:MAG: hypothetical protein KKH51_11690 [Actinobacteria bacterium]|nr:hypothetical protein [Actinomycetota bacterium]
MTTISQFFAAALQPILISVATVAVLALIRLITPTVRWDRRLKRDGAIYGLLPEGKEKEIWAASVTAQAERIRLYREDLSLAEHIAAWYAFFALVTGVPALIWEATHGWEGFNEVIGGGIWTAIPGALLLAMNLAFAFFVTVRLILGRSTTFRAGSGGHYPKYETLRRVERRRKARRSAIEVRLAHAQGRADASDESALE